MVNNDLLREWPFNTRLPNQNTDVVCIILVLFYCKLLLVIYLFSEYTFFNRLLAIHHLVCVSIIPGLHYNDYSITENQFNIH